MVAVARPAAAAASVAPPVAASARVERQAERRARARRADSTRPMRVELQQIEARLDKLGAEKSQVEAALSGSASSATDFAELGRRLALHEALEAQPGD